MARERPIADRFWEKVRKTPETDGCWLWTAHTVGWGYGSIRARVRGRWSRCYAHRLSWELHHGEIPDGLQVLHRCDQPLCVRPDHLFLGTQADNIADKIAKGRQNRGETTPNARLTADLVRTLRARHAAGEKTASLALFAGVAPRTIRDAVQAKTWGHVLANATGAQ